MINVEFINFDNTDTNIYGTISDNYYFRFIKLLSSDGSSVVEKEIVNWGTVYPESTYAMSASMDPSNNYYVFFS
jgi:hypothetical protein